MDCWTANSHHPERLHLNHPAMTNPGAIEGRDGKPDEHSLSDDDLHLHDIHDGDSSDSSSHNRSGSTSSLSSFVDADWEFQTPIERLTVFDFLDNLALPQTIEKINRAVIMRRESFKRSTEKVKREYEKQKTRVINNIEIEKFKTKYSEGVDKLLVRWNDTKVISAREKAAFVVGVSNIFITGFLVGGYP